MKNILLIVLAISPLFASDYKSESTTTSEIFTSKVLKVYSFEDEKLEYFSYVVTWKDHEVVVTNSMYAFESKHYKVGDTIRCQMEQSAYRAGTDKKVRMIFTVVSGSTPADEQRRLEAVAGEIEKRRDLRAKALEQIQKP